MSSYTIGVEEEYQLVDPDGWDLRSRARDVLSIDWTGETGHEVQETQVEIATEVCGSAAEVDTEIRRLRFHAAAAASARDLVLVAAGLHPFSEWRHHRLTDHERYHRLIERYGRVIESEHVFGMHVHVEIPDGSDRMAAIGRMRHYLPHLLALSASSPIFDGSDTGYASYRTVLNGRLPCSGPPPAFESEPDYWEFTAGLIEQGVAVDEGTTYWTVRPHHRYPTIEVRCADVCPRVDDAVAVATLARTLIAAAAEDALPAGAEKGPGADAACAADHWQAARFGLEGQVRGPGGKLEPLRDAIPRLLEDVAPIAEHLGDAGELAGVERILERGNGAARIRDVAADADGLQPVLEWLARETLLGTGLDRPAAPRREGAPSGNGPGS